MSHGPLEYALDLLLRLTQSAAPPCEAALARLSQGRVGRRFLCDGQFAPPRRFPCR